jgi:hypothetical protein
MEFREIKYMQSVDYIISLFDVRKNMYQFSVKDFKYIWSSFLL